MSAAFDSMNYSRDSLIQKQETVIRKNSKNEFFRIAVSRRNRFVAKRFIEGNAANIKLQSIPAFFADARADAHEKMRVRLQFFFVRGY